VKIISNYNPILADPEAGIKKREFSPEEMEEYNRSPVEESENRISRARGQNSHSSSTFTKKDEPRSNHRRKTRKVHVAEYEHKESITNFHPSRNL
jgi:23S rRNA maturation-related 3'-5' exoribonuclease YhaM